VTDQMSRPAPPPLACDAREGRGGTTCSICTGPIAAGSREARLSDGSWCHIHPCLLETLGGRP
jgi:hypothetical protein